ncbi:hypothetical protein Y032_0086g1954 [Ancylostoma ceylanicum]|uniref:Uncharacterized protein n=1 Tax=Ancylostoma ceylanicum TaxID=53326 RepID=A0A016TQ00_9BILA|nr:hypothetical protein Y032_0086g1954 [Ancylostoma ceylanicum]
MCAKFGPDRLTLRDFYTALYFSVSAQQFPRALSVSKGALLQKYRSRYLLPRTIEAQGFMYDTRGLKDPPLTELLASTRSKSHFVDVVLEMKNSSIAELLGAVRVLCSTMMLC